MRIELPQTGQRLGTPSGVRDEGIMVSQLAAVCGGS
jgi:hypothetical protein